MARILLLDDSPTMHRVVRLTFADDQRIEIAVARQRAEAEQSLSAQQTDLIIAYVRFDGLTDPRYFETLRLVTPRILLLAESEENLEPFTRLGFSKVLRKPFHSDELRQVVEDMLAEDFQFSAASQQTVAASGPQDSDDANTVDSSQGFGEPLITLDLSFMQTAIETPNAGASTAGRTFEKQMRPPSMSTPPMSAPPASNPPSSIPPASAPPRSVQPQFPVEDSSATQTVLLRDSGSSHGASVNSGMKSSGASPIPPKSIDKVLAAPPPKPPPPKPSSNLSPSLSNPSRPSMSREVEPASVGNEPFDIEDVLVSTKFNPSPSVGRNRDLSSAVGARSVDVVAGISREEVERIVADSVASAVNRAVRQALNDTIPDLRQALVNEVSQRAVDQLTEEIIAVKRTLREQMLADLRDVSAQWLRKETPGLAKDVIREEIRRVIEGV